MRYQLSNNWIKESQKTEKPIEQLLSFPLKGDPVKTVQIGALLSKEEQNQLLKFLLENADIFAWTD